MEHSGARPDAGGPLGPDVDHSLVRAWQRAYYAAVNRSSPEVSAEDLLVGLFDEFGECTADFFLDPAVCRALVQRLRPTEIRQAYPEGASSESGMCERDQPTSFVGLRRSKEFEGIMEAIVHLLETPPPQVLSLDGFMRIFAQSPAAERLASQYSLRFR
jgi:hypothetical protein